MPSTPYPKQMAGGKAGVEATGPTARFTILNNTAAVGQTFRFDLVANEISYTFGAGDINGIVPTSVMAMGNRLYMAAGTFFYFSKIGDAELWEQQDTGAGFIEISDNYAAPANILALTRYQGRLAVLCRNVIEVWSTNADPGSFGQTQTLENIGTLAAQSVQSMGDYDVMFLHDTGIRSLRVRDASLNGFITDIGSPIDRLITDSLLAHTSAENEAACAIIEPSTARYWLYLNGVIYVLSYYPSLRMIAWSTYNPSHATAEGAEETVFAVEKFLIQDGRVYVLSTTGEIFLYGGDDNETYDYVEASVETPWLDSKTPYKNKQFTLINASFKGRWAIEAGADPMSDLELVYTSENQPDYDKYANSTYNAGGRVAFSANGTHCKFRATTTEPARAVLASLTIQYNLGASI